MSKIIALGFFDGVHIAHGSLLKKAKEMAENSNASPAVLSFDVHPSSVITGKSVPLISDCLERENIINRLYGINDVIFIHFNKAMMEMPWDEFLNQIVSGLDVSGIVCGFDFTFGAGGLGTAEKLELWCKEHNLSCAVCPEIRLDGITVSSTYIRSLIEEGDMETAKEFLGHPHMIIDTVRTGKRIGRSLGAPTINLAFKGGIVIPKYGVYATKVILDDGREFISETNIGVKPTFGDNDKPNIESHLLDFEGDLYGKTVRLDFYKFIRPEIKFESEEALSAQIRRDKQSVRNYFKEAIL